MCIIRHYISLNSYFKFPERQLLSRWIYLQREMCHLRAVSRHAPKRRLSAAFGRRIFPPNRAAREAAAPSEVAVILLPRPVAAATSRPVPSRPGDGPCPVCVRAVSDTTEQRLPTRRSVGSSQARNSPRGRRTRLGRDWKQSCVWYWRPRRRVENVSATQRAPIGVWPRADRLCADQDCDRLC